MNKKEIDKNISTCWNLLSRDYLEEDHRYDIMLDLIELYELRLYGHVVAERFKK